jgi:hypothetical protein
LFAKINPTRCKQVAKCSNISKNQAPSVSVERGDMISYYVEKLHARHFSAVRNFRAPPFAVVA